MRTTLSVDDDIYAFARQQAEREHVSMGQVISRLARAGIVSQQREVARLPQPRSRFALLPERNETITVDHVRKLMDQEGI